MYNNNINFKILSKEQLLRAFTESLLQYLFLIMVFCFGFYYETIESYFSKNLNLSDFKISPVAVIMFLIIIFIVHLTARIQWYKEHRDLLKLKDKAKEKVEKIKKLEKVNPN